MNLKWISPQPPSTFLRQHRSSIQWTSRLLDENWFTFDTFFLPRRGLEDEKSETLPNVLWRSFVPRNTNTCTTEFVFIQNFLIKNRASSDANLPFINWEYWIGGSKLESTRSTWLSYIPGPSHPTSFMPQTMDDYGSFQNEMDHPNNDNREDTSLLRNQVISKSSSSERDASSKRSWKIKTPFFVGMALWLVVMAAELSPFLFLVSTDEYQGVADTNNDDEYDDDDDSLLAMWGSTAYNVRMCSLQECLASPCQNSQSAPFVCLALKHDENIRGGCGATPWAFSICSDQCDTAGCSLLLERAEAAGPVVDDSTADHRNHLRGNQDCDVECPRNWCRKNRLCGDAENAPYQCTSGLSAYGCSADKFEWTLRSTEEECSSCCKTTSCEDWKAMSNDKCKYLAKILSFRLPISGTIWRKNIMWFVTRLPVEEKSRLEWEGSMYDISCEYDDGHSNHYDEVGLWEFPDVTDRSTKEYAFWLSKADPRARRSRYDDFEMNRFKRKQGEISFSKAASEIATVPWNR